jgi:hypothetical protein
LLWRRAGNVEKERGYTLPIQQAVRQPFCNEKVSRRGFSSGSCADEAFDEVAKIMLFKIMAGK